MYFLLSVFVSVAAAVIIYLNLPFLLLLCSPPSPSFLHCSSLPEDRAARPVIGYNTQIIKGEVHWILRATWWFLHNTSASATLPLHYKDFLYFFCSSSSYFAVTCLLFYLFFCLVLLSFSSKCLPHPYFHPRFLVFLWWHYLCLCNFLSITLYTHSPKEPGYDCYPFPKLFILYLFHNSQSKREIFPSYCSYMITLPHKASFSLNTTISPLDTPNTLHATVP